MVSPETMIGLAGPDAAIAGPIVGVHVTVYPLMALPPVSVGGAKLTVACALPEDAVAAVGRPGRLGARVTAML